jgi:homoserine kinase
MSRSATRTARVRVPASTSNLGGGFDCVGVAVDRWLMASVVAHDGGLAGEAAVTMTRSGALASVARPPEDDLVHAGFAMACAARKRTVPSKLEYAAESTIPVARGLGSSAAALVAGAMLANEALALGLAREEIAVLCARTEGHADNAGAAVFGGAVLGVMTGDDPNAPPYAFTALRVHPDLALVFAVPDFEIRTSAARAVLPATVPHATAVAAVAKAAALVQGLASGDGRLLAYALDDVLHVPYRRANVRGYGAIVDAARAAGAYGATLSGSGSTIAAVAASRAADGVAAAMQAAWAKLGIAADTLIAAKPAAAAGRG